MTSGISAGILAGRMVGGGLTDLVGWRGMLAVVAAGCLLCAVVGRALLPRGLPRAPGSWLSELLSAPGLLRTHPDLLIAATAGALWFFAFSIVWVGVSLALSLPPYGLSPSAVGLYSLAGLTALAATPLAGRMADRFGSRRIALALFDAGLFGAQVANQRRVLRLDQLRPAQLNSTYMVIYFVGGSIGAAVGGPIVATFGWPAAAGAAALAVIAAMAIYGPRRGGRTRRSAEPRC